MKDSRIGLSLKLFVTLSFIVMVAVNALAVLLPLNGIQTGAVSDAYPNLFAPAGITFSIWGLIYLLLGFFTLYFLGLFRGGERADAAMLNRTGQIFGISSLVNSAWIFSWHYNVIWLSMLLMAALLVCLIFIAAIPGRKKLSGRERLFVQVPFGIYFGWITVAAIANMTVLLVSTGWDGSGLPQDLWTVLLLIIGALIGSLVLLRFRNIAYGAVLIWAYCGILIKHTSPGGFAGRYPDVMTAAIFCIAALAVEIVFLVLHSRRKSAEAGRWGRP